MSLVRQIQTSEKIHVATQKMSKSEFFWNDKESRFTNTSSKIIVGEVSRNQVELLSLNEEKLITPLHVMNNFQEVNNLFRSSYLNKIENFVKLI